MIRRYGRGREAMVTVHTSADATRKMVEIRVNGDLAGSISPNLLHGMGVPIDVHKPSTWTSEVRLSKEFLKKIA